MENQLSGIWLSLEEKEVQFIWDNLPALGFSADTKGLKEYILDSLIMADEDEEEKISERVARKLGEYVKAHPDDIRLAGNMIGTFARKILKNRGR